MQILASALPGFRDLRAPLTAGYLWLILLWIVLKPHVATRPTNEIAGAVYDLGKSAGPIWIALGVSVCAYLIGSISQSLSVILDKGTAYFVERIKHISLMEWENVVKPATQSDLTAPSNVIHIQIIKLYRRAVTENRDSLYKQDKKTRDKFFRNLRMRATDAQRGLDAEIAMPATLLIGKEPELFTEADRLRAESQLRFAAVPPLTAIIAFLYINQSHLWVLGAIAMLILAWQGYWRNQEFNTLMLGAVQRGKIQSQSVQEFEQWVIDLGIVQHDQPRTTVHIASTSTPQTDSHPQ